ncbi:hypothetical protein F5880DRAFT_1662632 [Lentinula raphanica]|nr:hypothetical protein F5880DRAFT_1662632 [Lentinula raphanica]
MTHLEFVIQQIDSRLSSTLPTCNVWARALMVKEDLVDDLYQEFSSTNIMDHILALEILDHIVDKIRNNKQSLLAASSSGKGMLFRTRYHLFQSILSRQHSISPNGCDRGRNATDPWSVCSLLQILDAPYSSMGHAVHCLIVKFGFHSPQTLPTDLSCIRQNFPNIKTLHWRDDTWCNVLYAIKSLMFGLEIETFDISGVWFQDASELVQMIAMWPSMLWPNARNVLSAQGRDAVGEWVVIKIWTKLH